MSQVKSSTFILGTALLSVAILAIVWFLGASTSLSEASQAEADTKVASERNAQLRVETAKLADEFSRIGELQSELATLQTQIPGDDGITAFNRFVGELAAARGVTILSVTADPATLVLPLAAVPDAVVATDPVASDPATEPEGVANLYAISVSITVLGTYDNATLFLDDLQRASSRLYIVQTVNIAGQDAAEPSGGKPAIVKGEVEQVISGYVFVMPFAEIPATGDQPAGTEVS
ncbi:hypothetical protein SAMN05216410_1395 [Sanguibacter gelidistatuariae]|uniref:Tfp pilus assembly protein PilO n=1 Tax=Sanguibacter gelidistatuariae TaxID=1814289 RepID=A0A1G6JT69_9MICO|nr:hypothetical protein [Sanguibacter gelidistatuariae]SDC21196.1 hypothetical protein SAMN05216410_1395 [Sanguibacter gelidistatuariae]